MSLEYGSKMVEEAFEIPGTSTDPQSGAAQKGRINRQKQVSIITDINQPVRIMLCQWINASLDVSIILL